MPSLFSSDWDMLSRTASSCCHLLGQLPANFGQLALPLTGSQCNDTLFLLTIPVTFSFFFFYYLCPPFPEVLTGESWKLPAFPAAKDTHSCTCRQRFPLHFSDTDTYAHTYKQQLSNRSIETESICTPTLKLIIKAWYSAVYGYFCLCPTEC